ncbi:ATP synthase F0 subunit A [Paenibacillus glucanolyticus]|mgnify:CR=1 FL=1|jgi:F-type H+-transporting ATPase subunit a|uniref:F0F1 ATP synthase subunit A n=1 Tax=Paenibacillus TaxID=44249 RepID=UPI0003E279DB|nr:MULTISPECIES: F0F1 ATP synthase subunit A [Paenibacillus]ANA79821.1 F0F1 ATP synthase subunit A [Paenibacillus glucanolyticus]AVV56154.1 ATP synthase F0 subunit A [Paenibacillus glucanolyticus]ETT38197.1 ATP synthase F0 subunit A [Paenibacillus sp. FSL R5-808]MPY20216.1 F0F1 ATP synthase subunit A [Paenibacillus glucanolyticus]
MHDSPIIDLGGFRLDLSAVIMLLVTGIIVFVLARLAVRNLSVENPSKLQNFMEWVVEFVQGIVASAMDLKKGKPYISLGLTLITFIFVANVLGLPFAIITDLPADFTVFGQTIEATRGLHDGHMAHVLWWKSPTADISVTAGLAIVVFFLMNYLGLKLNRKHYLKHYIEPFPVFLPLNIIENLAKPVALAIRLFANIFAGEVLITVILKMGYYGIPFLAVWQGFSIFIGALQAFIFTILTMVYIAQTTIHEEDAH